jgi:pimeloyl-ACP methyl ester carboxylesterase
MSDWISGNVVANGIRIHFHRTGGDKPPLILSHGITDNGLCWTRTAQALEDNFDLILADARGHGLSDAPEKGYSHGARADDLAGFITALGLKKPFLMGHSMGADTTAYAAALYPELVGCAILEDPPWYEDSVSTESRAATADEWRTKIIERKSTTSEELVIAGRAEHPTWAEIEFEPWVAAKWQVSPNVVQVITDWRPGWRDIAVQIKCPTLVLIGDPARGSLVTPRVADEISGQYPHFTLAKIEGAGHSIRRDQFERFIGEVTTFLANFS